METKEFLETVNLSEKFRDLIPRSAEMYSGGKEAKSSEKESQKAQFAIHEKLALETGEIAQAFVTWLDDEDKGEETLVDGYRSYLILKKHPHLKIRVIRKPFKTLMNALDWKIRNHIPREGMNFWQRCTLACKTSDMQDEIEAANKNKKSGKKVSSNCEKRSKEVLAALVGCSPTYASYYLAMRDKPGVIEKHTKANTPPYKAYQDQRKKKGNNNPGKEPEPTVEEPELQRNDKNPLIESINPFDSKHLSTNALDRLKKIPQSQSNMLGDMMMKDSEGADGSVWMCLYQDLGVMQILSKNKNDKGKQSIGSNFYLCRSIGSSDISGAQVIEAQPVDWNAELNIQDDTAPDYQEESAA